jgi:hypothetical protein
MKNFCSDIHNNLSLTLYKNGIRVTPCCWYKEENLITDLTQDLWNNELLIDLRKSNAQDQELSNGCQQCVFMERNGTTSRRTGVNEYYNSTATNLSGPRGLEISFDYTCNLACIVCGPSLSTQWRLELETPKKEFPIRLDDLDIIKVLENLDLSNLDNIHFYGGDPLLTRTHEIILNYIDKKFGLDKIYVWYNTNGTVRVNQRVLDLWSKCRLIKVYFSIDDVGPRFEYIRYGASWAEVEDNVFWFKEHSPVNTMFTIQPTLNCLNALHHYEITHWKEQNFNTNRLGDFTDLSRHNAFGQYELTAMPGELVQKCLNNHTSDSWYTEFLQGFKFSPTQLEKTKQAIRVLDQRRGCNFSKTFPDLVPYFT